jgi:flagellar hook-associated protein 1 FlgK
LLGEVDDLTPLIKSGKLAALIDLRDNILPGLQDQIDQLAQKFADEINRAHNSAMPIPGLTRFAGEKEIATANLLDPLNPASLPLQPHDNGTVTKYGVLQFAVIDSSGNAVGDGLRIDLDEFKDEMEAYIQANGGGAFNYQVTLGDVVNMINGAYAAVPPSSIPVPPTPTGWPGAVPWPPAPPLTMTSSGSDIAGLYNLSGGSVTGGLANGAFAVVSNKRLIITLPSNSPYGLAIDDSRSSFDDGSGRASTFNYLMGLNNLFTIPSSSISASNDIEVRADILTDQSRIGRGYLTSVVRDPTNPATEEWYVASGDGKGARAMADAFSKRIGYTSAGTLPGSTQSLTEYAADIIQSNARAAKAADNDDKFEKDLLANIKGRMGAVSGVNIDEELSNLVNVQNNYAAAARIVTSVNAMYEDLLRLF